MANGDNGKGLSRRKLSATPASERERREEASGQRGSSKAEPTATLASSAHQMLGNARISGAMAGEGSGVAAILHDAMRLGAAGVYVASDVTALFANSHLNEWMGAHGGGGDAGMWAGEALSRHARDQAPPAATDKRLEVIGQGGGAPLPSAVREKMEAAFGHDFGHVRIHTGAGVARAADAISAHAFAQGPHIYFGEGEFSPGTQWGDHLLAHELQHVVQADEGRLPSHGSGSEGGMEVSSPNDAHEVEAERVAEGVSAEGGVGAVALSTTPAVEPLAGGSPSLGGDSISLKPDTDAKETTPTGEGNDTDKETPDIDALLGEATETAVTARVDKPKEDGEALSDTKEKVAKPKAGEKEQKLLGEGEAKSEKKGKKDAAPTAKKDTLETKAATPLQATTTSATTSVAGGGTSGKSSPEVSAAAEKVKAAAEQQKGAITAEGEAQKSAVRAAGAGQAAAIGAAISTLRSSVTSSFETLVSDMRARGETTKATLASQRDTQKAAITASASAELTRMSEAVNTKKAELETLGTTLSAEAKAHGQSEATRALGAVQSRADRAAAVGDQKAAQYAGHKKASEIAATARRMARETAGEIVRQGSEIAAQCTKDGEALAEKLTADAKELAKNLGDGINPATEAINEARDKALQSCDASHDDAVVQVDKAVTDGVAGVESGKAAALAQVEGTAVGILPGIERAVQSACSSIDQGVQSAISQLDGAVAEVTAAAGRVHESRAAEALKVLAVVEASVNETGAGAVTGLAAMGSTACESVSSAGSEGVGQVSAAGAPILAQNAQVKAGFDTSMEQIETSTGAAFTTAGTEAGTAMKAAADGFIAKVEEGFTEGKDKLTATSTDGKAEITKKVNDVVAKMDEALSTLGAEIDKKAREIENASWWDKLCSAVSGFFRGFFSQLWGWIKDILLVLAIILVVLVILIVLIVILVAIFPGLLGPLLAGLIFLAVWGPAILTVIGYIGLAIGIIMAAVSVYQCWKVWNNPNLTWEEKWEQTGRTAFDIVDAIGPEKFLKPIAGIFRGARGVDALSDAAKLGDVSKAADVTRLDDVADVTKLDDTRTVTRLVGAPRVRDTPRAAKFNVLKEGYELSDAIVDIKGGAKKIGDPNNGTVLEGRDNLAQ